MAKAMRSGRKRRRVTVGAGSAYNFFSLSIPHPRFPKVDIERLLARSLAVASILIPEGKTISGVLVASTSYIWAEIVKRLKNDWTVAYEIPPEKWEEIVAGAFKNADFDEVVLTPRSGDFGRDVIASRKGVGCVKVIGSVKAYSPGHLVKHDDVRALLGVLSGELNASKAILTTTSDFAPRIKSDPFIAPFLPTRLELVNGEELQKWLTELSKTSSASKNSS